MIAWVRSEGRPSELAAALEGEGRTFFDLGIVQKPFVPLRYLLSSLRTVLYLLVKRPRALIVQAPPFPLVAIAYAYGRVARAPVVIDSHPAAFGIESTSVDRKLLPLLARLAPRVSGYIVTTDELGKAVEGWGGRPLVVHEAPPQWLGECADTSPEPGRVLFVATFAPDEPLREVLEAARRLPDVRFGVTGDPRRLPDDCRRSAPPNVEWLGYLRPPRYPEELHRASVVLTLSDRRESVPRSAYEAVYAARPLVTSNWPHMRGLFPHAVLVENRADSIATGIREALGHAAEFEEKAGRAHRLQDQRWRDQVTHLREAVGFSGPSVGTETRGPSELHPTHTGGYSQ